jgi:hypothetical protein
MNTRDNIILPLLLIVLFLVGMFSGIFYEKYQQGSKGNECAKHLKDYQLNYYMDTVWIYDGQRLLGSHIDSIKGIEHGKYIDSLILADNY